MVLECEGRVALPALHDLSSSHSFDPCQATREHFFPFKIAASFCVKVCVKQINRIESWLRRRCDSANSNGHLACVDPPL